MFSTKPILLSGSKRSFSSVTGTRGRRDLKTLANSPTPRFRGFLPTLLTLTLSIPQLGEPLLKIKPERSTVSSSSDLTIDHSRTARVRSLRVCVVTRRGSSDEPYSSMGSLGTPKPHSTSGQTGIKVASVLKVSAMRSLNLLLPSHRTSCPARHELIPRLSIAICSSGPSFQNDPGHSQSGDREYLQ